MLLAAESDSAVGSLTVLRVLQGMLGYLGQILFGSIIFIAQTLLFVDLRNRKEGSDIAERLALIERDLAI